MFLQRSTVEGSSVDTVHDSWQLMRAPHRQDHALTDNRSVLDDYLAVPSLCGISVREQAVRKCMFRERVRPTRNGQPERLPAYNRPSSPQSSFGNQNPSNPPSGTVPLDELVTLLQRWNIPPGNPLDRYDPPREPVPATSQSSLRDIMERVLEEYDRASAIQTPPEPTYQPRPYPPRPVGKPDPFPFYQSPTPVADNPSYSLFTREPVPLSSSPPGLTSSTRPTPLSASPPAESSTSSSLLNDQHLSEFIRIIKLFLQGHDVPPVLRKDLASGLGLLQTIISTGHPSNSLAHIKNLSALEGKLASIVELAKQIDKMPK